MSGDDTTKEQAHSVRTPSAPLPGFIVCFAGGKPAYAAHPLTGRAVTIGRGGASTLVLDDERLSFGTPTNAQKVPVKSTE